MDSIGPKLPWIRGKNEKKTVVNSQEKLENLSWSKKIDQNQETLRQETQWTIVTFVFNCNFFSLF